MIFEKKNLEKKSLIFILLLAFTGLIISFYATQQTLLIYNFQSADPGLCEANTWISCDKAQASSEAMFIGIPVAWWGFLYYLWIGLTALWIVIKQSDKKRSGAGCLSVNADLNGDDYYIKPSSCFLF